ncbi:hypothetical protein CYMTET_27340 [Cymbomonas tetramitiformis]|uniref:C2 domain-containing protein n=1 Tax=Cymbomonas tetramitiformis TaxID=36881 RepID=A0AAE0FPZ3_9CHLO|nr:hypothetical protein CYMTET_27340 [Cymbomonas tetramitiformis]
MALPEFGFQTDVRVCDDCFFEAGGERSTGTPVVLRRSVGDSEAPDFKNLRSWSENVVHSDDHEHSGESDDDSDGDDESVGKRGSDSGGPSIEAPGVIDTSPVLQYHTPKSGSGNVAQKIRSRMKHARQTAKSVCKMLLPQELAPEAKPERRKSFFLSPEVQESGRHCFGKLKIKVLAAHLQYLNKEKQLKAETTICPYYLVEFDKTVYRSSVCSNTHLPSWTSDTLELNVHTHHQNVVVKVMDSHSDTMLGELSLSMFAIIEQQVSDSLDNYQTHEIFNQPVRDVIKESFTNPDAPKLQRQSQIRGKWYDLKMSSARRMGGKVKLEAQFEEDLAALVSDDLLDNPEPVPTEFGVINLKEAFDRIQALISTARRLSQQYQEIIQWRNRRRTWMVFVGLHFVVFTANFDYLMVYPLVCALIVMLLLYHRRNSGQYFIEHMQESSKSRPIRRQVATLRVQVMRAEIHTPAGMSDSDLNPFVSMVYCIPSSYSSPTSKKRSRTRGVAGVMMSLRPSQVGEQARESMEDADGGPERADDGDAADRLYYMGSTHTVFGSNCPNFQELEKHSGAEDSSDESKSKPRHAMPLGQKTPSKFRGGRDAVLHNVFENCCDPDDSETVVTLKYPILQLMHPNGRQVISWKKNRTLLQFNMRHEESAGATFLGSCSVPLSELLNKMKTGGTQEPLTSWFPLCVDTPEADLAETAMAGSPFINPFASMSPQPTAPADPIVGGLQLKLTLTLPERGHAQPSMMTQEMLEGIVETEEQGFLQKLKAASKVALDVQNTMITTAANIERLCNLFNWTHLHKTRILFAVILSALLVCTFVPMRYLMHLGICSTFYGGYKKHLRWDASLSKKVTDTTKNRIMNVLNSIPSRHAHREVFVWRNRYQQAMVDRSKITLMMQATWSGYLYKKGQKNTAWRSRFVLVRAGRVMWWGDHFEAIHGETPRGELLLEAPVGGKVGSKVEGDAAQRMGSEGLPQLEKEDLKLTRFSGKKLEIEYLCVVHGWDMTDGICDVAHGEALQQRLFAAKEPKALNAFMQAINSHVRPQSRRTSMTAQEANAVKGDDQPAYEDRLKDRVKHD